MRRGDCGQRKVSRAPSLEQREGAALLQRGENKQFRLRDRRSFNLPSTKGGAAEGDGGSRCALPTKHNRFTKQHPQTSEAKSLLSSSVPLLRQMTGRNRHLSEKAGGGNAADLLSLAQMVAVRKISCALKRRICPTGNMTFRGSTRRLFVAASTRRQNTPPWGTARWESRTYTSTSKSARDRFESAGEAFIGGPLPGNECFTPLNSPCEFNAGPFGRFFPPFLFEKRKAGAGRGLSGKGEKR